MMSLKSLGTISKRIISLPNSCFCHCLTSTWAFLIFINNFGDCTPTMLRRNKLKIHQGNKWFFGCEITAIIITGPSFHGVLLYAQKFRSVLAKNHWKMIYGAAEKRKYELFYL